MQQVSAQVTVALARAVRRHGEAGETGTHSVDRCLEIWALADTVLLLYILHLRALAGLPVGSGSVPVRTGALTAGRCLVDRTARNAAALVYAQDAPTVACDAVAGCPKTICA